MDDELPQNLATLRMLMITRYKYASFSFYHIFGVAATCKWVWYKKQHMPLTSNTSRTLLFRTLLVGNDIVDYPNVVGALPVGPTPTTFSFLTKHVASMDWANITA